MPPRAPGWCWRLAELSQALQLPAWGGGLGTCPHLGGSKPKSSRVIHALWGLEGSSALSAQPPRGMAQWYWSVCPLQRGAFGPTAASSPRPSGVEPRGGKGLQGSTREPPPCSWPRVSTGSPGGPAVACGAAGGRVEPRVWDGPPGSPGLDLSEMSLSWDAAPREHEVPVSQSPIGAGMPPHAGRAAAGRQGACGQEEAWACLSPPRSWRGRPCSWRRPAPGLRARCVGALLCATSSSVPRTHQGATGSRPVSPRLEVWAHGAPSCRLPCAPYCAICDCLFPNSTSRGCRCCFVGQGRWEGGDRLPLKCGLGPRRPSRQAGRHVLGRRAEPPPGSRAEPPPGRAAAGQQG